MSLKMGEGRAGDRHLPLVLRRGSNGALRRAGILEGSGGAPWQLGVTAAACASA